VLDLDESRAAVPPRDAATLLLVRDGTEAWAPCVEVFCVVRHAKSGFMGGAVVFPGGKVDGADREPAWAAIAKGARRFGADDQDDAARAFAIAACREAMEEAAILMVEGAALSESAMLALRAELKAGTPFRAALEARHLSLDLGALRPFARWVTPVAESRRFDTRFFIAAAPRGQEGAHDAHETTATFWRSPRSVLQSFDRGELQLMPPTHRSLERLATTSCAADALALADGCCLDPICPKLVPVGNTMALALPGDREHDVATSRVPGSSRFVLRGERWRPE
jgi:8-oxo-dGTP pyrophosphatase MutT (NUDIX family)